MQLKEYQNNVLDRVSDYLRILGEKREEAEEVFKILQERRKSPKLGDWCEAAWKDVDSPVYVPRFDGLNRPIPNVCLKVPTGGGKTLLGCAAIERLGTEFFRKQTGFILWVVPSDAIYTQTWNLFANRESPYRQMLERASGGRVRLLEKNDSFTRQDVEEHLCVMLLMLQSGARKSKEQLKMFQDSGRFTSFFPEVDDFRKNEALVQEVANLDRAIMTDEEYRSDWLTVRQSLGNVLRIVRPIIVVDEGHKAYSNIAFDTMCGFNPRFILELTATPNAKEHISNVLVNVDGTALKNEQMIKLPINLINEDRADWKHTLAAAKEKLDELVKDARKVQNNEGRYIRPIMLVRVERTGKEQRDKSAVHSEDAREFLQDKLGAKPEEIKVKSAEMDELTGIDLLSDRTEVRYIITKDALREGWDCPFAYVLVILSKTTAATALTQMVGRVLRQPHAALTSVDALNECYVFTFDQEVQAAIESVRKGLMEEGMGDIAASVRAMTKGGALGLKRKTIHRRKGFEALSIFLPRVLSKHYSTGEWRVFDYDRDLLSRLDWESFSYTDRETFAPEKREKIERTLARVSVEDLGNVDDSSVIEKTEQDVEPELDIPALVRILTDVVPNPWQGARILNETLAELRKRDITEARLYTNRLYLIKEIKDDIKAQVNTSAEKEFRRMLEKGEICFRLEVSKDPRLNWELAKTIELELAEEDKVLRQRSGEDLERALFDPVYQKQFNGLEKDVAWYLDGDKAVHWWHRIAVKSDWHLQGWQRNRIYPDFLVCLQDSGDGKVRMTVLETKGLHLKGSEDTEYKQSLFDLFTKYYETGMAVGELALGFEDTHRLRFELLLENNWRDRLEKMFP